METLINGILQKTIKEFPPEQLQQNICVDGIFVITVNSTHPSILETKEFGKIIKKKISSGHTRLVVDLSKCEIIDFIFFRTVIIALMKITNLGGKLNLVEPANPKEDIFTIANTLKLFDRYKTREDAIKYFYLEQFPYN